MNTPVVTPQAWQAWKEATTKDDMPAFPDDVNGAMLEVARPIAVMEHDQHKDPSGNGWRERALVKFSQSTLHPLIPEWKQLDGFVRQRLDLQNGFVHVLWRNVWIPTDLLRVNHPWLFPHQRNIIENIEGEYPSLGERVGQANDAHTGEAVAIKGETDQDVEGRLKHELKIYEVLRGLAEVPTLKNFVTDRNAKEFMILELLGTSLETLFNYCERQLTVKDLVALAIKLLELSQQIHERNVIHGCLVPEHILVGDGWKGNDFVGNTQGAKLHAISLSRARIYTNDDNDRLLPAARSAELCYANPFAGLCAHRDKQPSRPGDLESIFLILVYLFRGRLPWDHEDDPETMMRCKMTVSVAELCEGLPDEFAQSLTMVRGLGPNQKPDYLLLYHMFGDLANRLELPSDFTFTWMSVRAKHLWITELARYFMPEGSNQDEILKPQNLTILSDAAGHGLEKLEEALKSMATK